MVTVKPESKAPRPGKRLRIAANLLILAGLLLALSVAGLYAYGRVEEQRFAQESEQRREAFEAERAAIEQQQAEQERIERERAALLETPLPTFQKTPNPPAAAVSGAPASASPARRVIIPAIGVNSEVVESQVKNGEWLVPKFVVGHLQGTANPGQSGNAVFSGHIQSISSGNVFARLGDLENGDQIYLLTAEGQYLYEVKRKIVVANTDLSVVQPTAEPRVTLITCTGTWDFRTQDYLQRLVVIAERYKDISPAKLAIQPR